MEREEQLKNIAHASNVVLKTMPKTSRSTMGSCLVLGIDFEYFFPNFTSGVAKAVIASLRMYSYTNYLMQLLRFEFRVRSCSCFFVAVFMKDGS